MGVCHTFGNMADSKKLFKWQVRDYNVLKGTVGINRDFEQRAGAIREQWHDLDDHAKSTAIFKLIRDYDLPRGSWNFLEVYIATGKQDPSKLVSNITVEATKDGTAEPDALDPELAKWYLDAKRLLMPRPEVRIILGPETTREELDDFLNQNWKSIIRPRLKNLPGAKQQYRTANRAERDNDIIDMLEAGLSRNEIADRIWDKYGQPFTPEDVSKVINRKRKK